MAPCNRCGKPAAYTRKYSGESLCKSCFIRSIQRKAARTISKHKMIGYGDLVCAGISGGKDSLALLHVLSEFSEKHDFELQAVTIDEGIPGYREEALDIVARYCAKLKISHTVYSYADLYGMTLDEALEKEGRASSCSICGILRRRALDHAAARMGADVVATGHNLDDTLQTFLINMISGDAARMEWMDPDLAPGRGRRIKPFCEIYESEIVFYAFLNGMPFQTEPCPHMDEGIRTELREFLNGLETHHAGAKNGMYNSVLKVAQAMRGAHNVRGGACERCGSRCTGAVCSVCLMLEGLRGAKTNANIHARPNSCGSR